MGGQCTDARVAAASAVIAGALLPTSRRVDDEWVLLAVGAADDNVVGLSRLLAGLLLRIGRLRSEPLADVADRVGAAIDGPVASGPFGFAVAATADARLLAHGLAEALATGRTLWDPSAEFAGSGSVPIGRVTKALGIAALGAVHAFAELRGCSAADVVRAGILTEPVAPRPALV